MLRVHEDSRGEEAHRKERVLAGSVQREWVLGFFTAPIPFLLEPLPVELRLFHTTTTFPEYLFPGHLALPSTTGGLREWIVH